MACRAARASPVRGHGAQRLGRAAGAVWEGLSEQPEKAMGPAWRAARVQHSGSCKTPGPGRLAATHAETADMRGEDGASDRADRSSYSAIRRRPAYCRPPWASRCVAVRGRMAVCAAGWSGVCPLRAAQVGAAGVRLACGCEGAVRTRYGPPEVVQISQVGKPVPGGHELLVKVHATTVNRTDCHYRSGRPWIMRPLLSGLARPRAPVLGNQSPARLWRPGMVSLRSGSATGYSGRPRVRWSPCRIPGDR